MEMILLKNKNLMRPVLSDINLALKLVATLYIEMAPIKVKKALKTQLKVI